MWHLLAPTLVLLAAPPAPRATLATGADHTCLLAPGGPLRCWGGNVYGQLGAGGPVGECVDPGPPRLVHACSKTPVPVKAAVRFGAVDAGHDFTCALDEAGKAWCWGLSMQKRLGNPDAKSTCGRPPDDVPCSLEPLPVEGGRAFAQITVGRAFACGVTAEGAAWCWGDDSEGTLGDDARLTDQGAPVAVAGDHRWASVSAGSSHVCGVTASGETLCWGDGKQGELGAGCVGLLCRRPTPAPVRSEARFARVFAGIFHTCALTADGEAWCWGQNRAGELGVAPGAAACRPFDGFAGDQGKPCSPVPVKVDTALRFTALAAGGRSTCGLTADGAVHCWGVLDDVAGPGLTPCEGEYAGSFCARAPRRVEGLPPVAALAAGASHHTCALAGDGSVSCWGGNSMGQLGNGARTLVERKPVRAKL